MQSLINFLVLLASGILLYVLKRILTKPHSPQTLKPLPLVKGWPLVGVLFCYKETLYSYLSGLSLEHGPIFKCTLGCRQFVILNNSTIMKKTLKDMGNNFAGRWRNILVQTSIHDSGIVNKDKEWWVIQRNFVLKVLKGFGLGKRRSQEIVEYECAVLMKEIEESCGKVINSHSLFPKCTVNVICKFVMNMRFENSDPDFIKTTALIEKMYSSKNIFVLLLIMYPILEKFETLSKMLLWLAGREHDMSQLHNYFKGIIEEHKTRFDPENEGEDVIDMFLKEKYELGSKGGKEYYTFTDWQLIRIVFELFTGAYETTSTTLSWSMVLLAKHPWIQEKVHQEIIDVIGTSRTLSLTDKKSLPYTEAVMDEILRFSSVVPLSVPHRLFENTEVEGYFISKESIILPNIYGIHHDKDRWERPFEFYPEHFLSKIDGQYQYTPREELMPFGIGKRQCLGESLARLEYFTFLTSILQRFKVRFAKEVGDKEFERIKVGTDAFIRAPLYSDFVFDLW